ncbi:unnamed protein product [Adineta ricciae]|uniref:Uncharacterized protein n=1 Tax=Adineta ricciae TaxID=249248 RepID=A0A815YVB0_ADIRI|nr:unnamed protein product [Adineta ricciae]CAF1576205.1 unnamed protein product [Adineta ricciae]
MSELSSPIGAQWAEVFTSGDLDKFQVDSSGNKHTVKFYDYFPELEDAAREHKFEQYSKKSVDFTALDLAKIIDKKCYGATNITKGRPLAY